MNDGSTPVTNGDSSADAASPARDAAIVADATVADGSSPPTPPADAALADVFAPLSDGGELVQFVTSDETTYFAASQEVKSTGAITFGAANASASDDAVANLTRTGGQAAIGTDGAEEIVSNRMFSFGTFRFRLSLATCASTEEVVNGPFAYFNDGTLAPDGLVVNREVDIEILCGEPWLINLTIWTEFTDEQHLKNQSRVVDTKTGTVYVYADDSQGTETGTENHPELVIPGFPQAGAFYEMGWTWAADRLTYFIVVDGTPVMLWNATEVSRIPQAPMEQHFNIWAPGTHWSTGNTAAVPAKDATSDARRLVPLRSAVSTRHHAEGHVGGPATLWCTIAV